MRHYTYQSAPRELLAERARDVVPDYRLTPLIGSLGEHLDGGGPDGHAAPRRGGHPPLDRYMRAEHLGRRPLTHSRLVTKCPAPRASRSPGHACCSPVTPSRAPTVSSAP